jgi:hypothetical protein
MTLDRFMDVTYTLLVEDIQRMDAFKDFTSLRETILPADARVEKVPKQSEVDAQNQASLQQLQQMMSGVSRTR